MLTFLTYPDSKYSKSTTASGSTTCKPGTQCAKKQTQETKATATAATSAIDKQSTTAATFNQPTTVATTATG